MDLQQLLDALNEQTRKVNDLRAENERLRAAVADVIKWMEAAPFDYHNGVECGGVDEGNVRGWQNHVELLDKCKAALDAAGE